MCVPVFTAGSLLGVGLGVSARDAFAPLAHPRFVLVTLLVGWVVCPAVAWLLLAMVPLDRPYAVGLLVLSLAPAAPFVPAMAQVARSDTGHTAAFMLLATVATVVLLPFGVSTFVGGTAPPPVLIARPLIAFVLLPLLAGLAARQFDHMLAKRARRPVALITNVAGAGVLIAIVPLYGPGMLSAVGSYAIATQIVFVAAVTLIAYVAAAGLPPAAKTVMTIGMCSRNLGAALAPLAMIESDPRAIVMIAIAAPITVAGSLATARWLAGQRSAVVASVITVALLSLPVNAFSQAISTGPRKEPC